MWNCTQVSVCMLTKKKRWGVEWESNNISANKSFFFPGRRSGGGWWSSDQILVCSSDLSTMWVTNRPSWIDPINLPQTDDDDGDHDLWWFCIQIGSIKINLFRFPLCSSQWDTFRDGAQLKIVPQKGGKHFKARNWNAVVDKISLKNSRKCVLLMISRKKKKKKKSTRVEQNWLGKWLDWWSVANHVSHDHSGDIDRYDWNSYGRFLPLNVIAIIFAIHGPIESALKRVVGNISRPRETPLLGTRVWLCQCHHKALLVISIHKEDEKDDGAMQDFNPFFAFTYTRHFHSHHLPPSSVHPVE